MLEIDLSGQEAVLTEGHSSKGNQPKWLLRGCWYKADHMGYEALSEVLTSRLLARSGVENFVRYEPIVIHANSKTYTGCKSGNFRRADEMLVPLERLYRSYYGQSLAKKLSGIPDVEEQIRFTVEFVEQTTGLRGFGQYLSAVLELDAFILNEDRHTNNIAVLRNETSGQFKLCPLFDNGLSFLSDLNDYPLDEDIYQSIARVDAKPFSRDFITQLEAVTNLYGSFLHFDISRRDIDGLFDGLEMYYPEEIMNRVRTVLSEQMRKFAYLF